MHTSKSFVDPAEVLLHLPIELNQTVVDFGCGAGYFSLEFAKRVGGEGKVIALDILPSALEAVLSRGKTIGLTNIVTERVNLEKIGGSHLLAESVDWVVIKDMLFQNTNKQVILEEALRVLRPGGFLFVMEWKPETTSVGPRHELRIAEEGLQKLLETVGFSVESTIPVGAFHYAFLCRK